MNRMMFNEHLRDHTIGRLSDSGRRDQFAVSVHKAYAAATGVNAGVKVGHWGGVKPGQFAVWA